MRMYNTKDLMDRVIMEMDDDHVVIDASDIVLHAFTENFNDNFIAKNSIGPEEP